MTLGAGDDVPTQLVPFDLRSAAKAPSAKWSERQTAQAPLQESTPHTLATDPLRQSLLVRNRHDTLRSVNKLAVKMYNDNMVRCAGEWRTKTLAFRTTDTAARNRARTECKHEVDYFSPGIHLRQEWSRARLTHSEAAYGFDALLETQTQDQWTMELPTMRSPFVWVPTTVWWQQASTSKSQGTRVVDQTQSMSLENTQRKRSLGVAGCGSSISGEGGGNNTGAKFGSSSGQSRGGDD